MPPPLTSTTTLKRIHHEIADLKKEDLGPITLKPSPENLFLWKATLPGPEGSCYEGGIFEVDINLPADYPFTSPKMIFRTRIYHMNISEHGGICIDILKHNWSPALSLFKVILSLSSLLTDPNPKDPLVPSIAKEYVSNRKKHDNTARQWTQLYAHPQHSQCPPLAKTPLPSPGPSRVGARSRRRQLPPVPSPQPTTSSSEPITIDDSDNEHSTIRRARPNRTTGNKRKRDASGSDALAINGDTSAGPSRTRRQRNIGNDVVDVDGVIVIDDD